MNDLKRLIAITGPTAIGKTSLSIALAERIGTEILSSDSRQFYREMRIGTAVPEPFELEAVKHHFIQHISIFDEYNAGKFESDALELLDELYQVYDDFVMVGGSAMYMDAVLYGLDDFPPVAEKIKRELQEEFETYGIAYLQDELKVKDPETYASIDLQNPRRLMRALEVCRASGRAFSSFKKRERKKRNFRHNIVMLDAPRDVIYSRIEQRVDVMMQKGLLEEAEKLYPYRDLKALQTVGYKELFRYMDGEWTLDFAVSEIKKNTRRFAKRQLTWYRNRKDIIRVDYKIDAGDLLKILEEPKK